MVGVNEIKAMQEQVRAEQKEVQERMLKLQAEQVATLRVISSNFEQFVKVVRNYIESEAY